MYDTPEITRCECMWALAADLVIKDCLRKANELILNCSLPEERYQISHHVYGAAAAVNIWQPTVKYMYYTNHNNLKILFTRDTTFSPSGNPSHLKCLQIYSCSNKPYVQNYFILNFAKSCILTWFSQFTKLNIGSHLWLTVLHYEHLKLKVGVFSTGCLTAMVTC